MKKLAAKIVALVVLATVAFAYHAPSASAFQRAPFLAGEVQSVMDLKSAESAQNAVHLNGDASAKIVLAQTYDHTWNPTFWTGPHNPGVTLPLGAMWTYPNVQVHWCSENTYPWCDAIANATCTGFSCPTRACSFYCSYNLFDGSGCPPAGFQSTSSPGAMGYWYGNTCGG